MDFRCLNQIHLFFSFLWFSFGLLILIIEKPKRDKNIKMCLWEDCRVEGARCGISRGWLWIWIWKYANCFCMAKQVLELVMPDHLAPASQPSSSSCNGHFATVQWILHSTTSPANRLESPACLTLHGPPSIHTRCTFPWFYKCSCTPHWYSIANALESS